MAHVYPPPRTRLRKAWILAIQAALSAAVIVGAGPLLMIAALGAILWWCMSKGVTHDPGKLARNQHPHDRRLP